jgi:hypothetical protein
MNFLRSYYSYHLLLNTAWIRRDLHLQRFYFVLYVYTYILLYFLFFNLFFIYILFYFIIYVYFISCCMYIRIYNAFDSLAASAHLMVLFVVFCITFRRSLFSFVAPGSVVVEAMCCKNCKYNDSDLRVPRFSWPYITARLGSLATWRTRSTCFYPPGTGWPQSSGFPFRHLPRLTGLRWRYSNPPSRGLYTFHS